MNAGIHSSEPAEGGGRGERERGGGAELSAELAKHHLQQQQLVQQQQAYIASLGSGGCAGVGDGQVLLVGMGGFDRSMYSSVLRAFQALEANAVESDHMLSQVGYFLSYVFTCVKTLCVHVYVCMYVCMCVCMCVYACVEDQQYHGPNLRLHGSWKVCFGVSAASTSIRKCSSLKPLGWH